MKTFHCTACHSLVFFENTRCLTCKRVLAFVPKHMAMLALEPQADEQWRCVGEIGARETLRLCRNYSEHAVCNWAMPAGDSEPLCLSCGLTHTIPDLSVEGNEQAWLKLETAKRRLVYSLLTLALPLKGKVADPQDGLEFRFLSDRVTVNGDRARVLTGHDDGVITINVAEADDVYRERMRLSQHEPYRTLLGHFRHEIGHYYWDRLIAGSGNEAKFRTLFGDERADYNAALKVHYDRGAPADWTERFISAYASMHPWEDWAETWAHVMHMVDSLETSHAVGLSVQPARPDEPSMSVPAKPVQARIADFDELMSEWSALTYVLNNLTRGLGLSDAYPFVISSPVIEKLRFVCQVMTRSAPTTTREQWAPEARSA
ncbi:MAG TPA: putative zinc-binding peptidase [Steroidobacteraceae bacterium]|nr:putative zinc-binding peptidase [Steroidobacteraceae bacterium]